MSSINTHHSVKLLNFKKATVLYNSHEQHPWVYRIIKGHVIIYNINIDGKAGLTDIYGQGDCFGPGLCGGTARQSAKAKTNCSVERISQAEFKSYIADDSILATTVIQQLSQREQNLQQRLFLQQTTNLSVRLVQLLLYLFNQQGQPCHHGHDSHVKLSQQELAEMVGASRQSVNSLLSKWRRTGLVDYTRSYICLENIDRLQDLHPL